MKKQGHESLINKQETTIWEKDFLIEHKEEK